ncbi:MAG: Rpn family recombination-promoting nuclease/putative transposase [Sodalis sp. (in: enterobacteria)]|uniref:Rpn family recombination-promoting nuclease/putative transposase n=1 Tax=Sodalis sp. (in: enterobacteria) TaxID=1898979 RepID=UPI0039E2542A
MPKTPLHHDALFKKFLGDIAVARDFLDIHLPPSIRTRCDLSTLAMESGSFVEDDLRSRLSDMLYSVETTASASYIYCLIEHQSRPEKLMPLRLHRYSLAAMQRHIDQGHEKLPVVISLLFYHGRTSPYPYSTRWLDCFADPELAKSVYMQAFPLVDITAMPDDEILTHRRVALLELVQKHIRTRDMLELASDIARLLQQWSVPREQFQGLMYYIVERGNTSDAEQFLHDIAAQIANYREDIMTIAEQLRLKGRQEGRQETRIQIARQLLANGVDREVVKLSTGLNDAELDNL